MDLSNNIVVSSSKEDECIELKHIQYKSMIQNGSMPIVDVTSQSASDLSELEKFLEQSTETTKQDRWNKLDKTAKIQRFKQFVSDYGDENNYNEEEKSQLFDYLKDCVDKKKLLRVKDVVYDQSNDTLVSIPGLLYNKTNKKFTIKNTDTKRGSVTKNLPKRVKTKTLKKDKKEAVEIQS